MFPLSGLLKHRPPFGSRTGGLGWPILVAAMVVAALGVYLSANSGTSAAQAVGDVSVLLAALAAAASCGRAALGGGLHGAAPAFVWAGMGIWTYYGLASDHIYPFPSLADVLFLSYSVPAAVALFSFRRPGGTRVGLLRTVLDAAVIAGAVLVVSWYTALGPVFSSEGDPPHPAHRHGLPGGGRGHHVPGAGPRDAPAARRTAAVAVFRRRPAGPHRHGQHLCAADASTASRASPGPPWPWAGSAPSS